MDMGNAIALLSPLSLVTVLGLVASLVVREVASSSSSARARALARALDLAVPPLLLVFTVTVAIRAALAL
jgi:hypothetical protein